MHSCSPHVWAGALHTCGSDVWTSTRGRGGGRTWFGLLRQAARSSLEVHDVACQTLGEAGICQKSCLREDFVAGAQVWVCSPLKRRAMKLMNHMGRTLHRPGETIRRGASSASTKEKPSLGLTGPLYQEWGRPGWWTSFWLLSLPLRRPGDRPGGLFGFRKLCKTLLRTFELLRIAAC